MTKKQFCQVPSDKFRYIQIHLSISFRFQREEVLEMEVVANRKPTSRPRTPSIGGETLLTIGDYKYLDDQ